MSDSAGTAENTCQREGIAMPHTILLSTALDFSTMPQEFREPIANLLLLPPVLFSLVLAYLSGHVWAYVLLARLFPDPAVKSVEARQNQYIQFVLNHVVGRVAIGLLWLALWLLALAVLPWLIFNHNLSLTTDYLTDRLVMIWIIAMSSQAVLSAVLLLWRYSGGKTTANSGAKSTAKAAADTKSTENQSTDSKTAPKRTTAAKSTTTSAKSTTADSKSTAAAKTDTKSESDAKSGAAKSTKRAKTKVVSQTSTKKEV